MVDIPCNEKYIQIKFETINEITNKESLTKENKGFDKQFSIEKKNKILLKEKFIILKRVTNVIKELIGLSISSISYLYYYSSLEVCLKGQEVCSGLVEWQLIKVYQEFKSCILIVFIFELIFYKFLSYLHLIHFLLVLSMFYIYSHGMEFEDHGYYNFFFFFIMISLIIILLVPFNFLVYIIKKKTALSTLFIYILFLIITIYFF